MVEVPRMPFFIVSGSGDPNGEEFAKATEALYSMSYAVRMSCKSEDVPVGYYEYTVFPLEGVWDLNIVQNRALFVQAKFIGKFICRIPVRPNRQS